MTVTIRSASPSDVPQLMKLMRKLAVFEDYIDDFAVTEGDLLRHGFGPNQLYHAHVADMDLGDTSTVVGMAVTYVIPWTYSMRPRLVLKEFFVQADARGSGAGRALMTAVRTHAEEIGASQITWTVMKGNKDAENFYRTIGGEPDPKWANWQMDVTPPH